MSLISYQMHNTTQHWILEEYGTGVTRDDSLLVLLYYKVLACLSLSRVQNGAWRERAFSLLTLNKIGVYVKRRCVCCVCVYIVRGSARTVAFLPFCPGCGVLADTRSHGRFCVCVYIYWVYLATPWGCSCWETERLSFVIWKQNQSKAKQSKAK